MAAIVKKEEVKTTTPSPLPKEGFVVVAMDIKYNPLYHPYQRRWVPSLVDCSEGLEMQLDSWLDSQIKAGLITVIK